MPHYATLKDLPAYPMTPATVVIDLGGTHLRLGHLSAEGPSTDEYKLGTEGLRQDEPIAFLARTINAYAHARHVEVTSVVLGVPFTPDRHLTTAVSSPNIRNLEGVPLTTDLSAVLGCPVRLERDINLLLLGEWQAGSARDAQTVFGMFVGTGVGGCYLEGGVPFRGATGAALELGHIPIRAEGARCGCGNLDCLEAYACGRVLAELAAAVGADVRTVFRDAPRYADLPRRLERFVDDLARALATGVNLFHPEVALVGGGVPAMPGFPRDRFTQTFYAHMRRPVPAETIKLEWAQLGSRASLYGALASPL